MTFLFDLLHVDGEDLLDTPLEQRAARLEAIAPNLKIPGVLTSDPREGERVLDEALRAGHEGVVVKDAASLYAAGRRGKAWRKVKPVQTYDLVVLGAEWGHGRRRGWLSNLHLGARDPRTGEFVMVGKTFKGLTDELLEWQTKALLEREASRQGIAVFVRPELVVEIALDGVQSSTRYPGGVALRFARVKRYRPDKTRRGSGHDRRPALAASDQVLTALRDRDADALVGLAFGLRLDDTHVADLAGRSDVRSPVGLTIQADDVDHPQRVDRARDQVGLEPHQRRVKTRLGAGQEQHADGKIERDLLVDARLDGARELLRHGRQLEVEATFTGSHVGSGDECAIVEPDDAVQDVLGGVDAHQEVAPVPVDRSVHGAPDAGHSVLCRRACATTSLSLPLTTSTTAAVLLPKASVPVSCGWPPPVGKNAVSESATAVPASSTATTSESNSRR